LKETQSKVKTLEANQFKVKKTLKENHPKVEKLTYAKATNNGLIVKAEGS
jgi:hypothetical protein